MLVTRELHAALKHRDEMRLQRTRGPEPSSVEKLTENLPRQPGALSAAGGMQVFWWDVQKCRVSPAVRAGGWQVRLRASGSLPLSLIFKIPCHAQPPSVCGNKFPEAVRGQGSRYLG